MSGLDPYATQFDDIAFRMRQMFGVAAAITNPRAHAVITGVISDVVRPVAWRLWTRQMAGVQEAERDRVRRGHPFPRMERWW